MRKVKRLLCVFLSAVMTLSLSSTAFASEKKEPSSIVSVECEDALYSYSSSVFSSHLHALLDAGELSGTVSDYTLGQSFSVFNIKDQASSTCFPVLYGGEFVAVLEVVKLDGEYLSSLSASFAHELSDFFSTNQMNRFALISDGIRLLAYDGVETVEIFQLYQDNDVFARLDLSNASYLFSESKATLSATYEELITPSVEQSGLRGPEQPKSYKTLNVAGVSQGNHPWCWAATCAALINYYKGYNLTASNVANYVFPNNPEQAGNFSNMQTAYNHWGLYPSESSGAASFSTVKTNINQNKPLHIRLTGGSTGHSVGLIGYEDWVGVPGVNARIIIILEPNGGVRRSLTLNSSGNFSYSLGGASYSWSKTITF